MRRCVLTIRRGASEFFLYFLLLSEEKFPRSRIYRIFHRFLPHLTIYLDDYFLYAARYLSSSTMNLLEKITNYAYVGLFPNSIAALCAVRDAPRMLEEIAHGNYGQAIAVTVPVAMNVFVGYLKYQEYRDVKRGLASRGWDSRIVKPKMYSWCQRHAAKQAAQQTGYGAQFEAFAQKEGHRWYHFLPKVHRLREVVS